MSAVFETLDPIVVASVRHDGPHTPASTDHTWQELILWASPRRFLGRRFDLRGVGLLWDDPRITEPDRRRYDVGIPIDPEDISDVDEPAFVNITMPGTYLRARHEGAYDTIHETYRQVFSVTFTIENLLLVAAPIIECYRNSAAEVDEEELVTDVYFPVIAQ